MDRFKQVTTCVLPELDSDPDREVFGSEPGKRSRSDEIYVESGNVDVP
jgi:hypothetical protein